MICLRSLCVIGAAAVAAFASSSADAGWGSRHGGSHGSSGGYGSYGSYGSYAGTGGSYASTGGSSGYASYSSYAAYSSYGSSGASYSSSGASYGSSGAAHGSSGGDGHVGPLRRLFARLHARKASSHHGSNGSSGYSSYYGGSSGGANYGSSGGSSGYASYSAYAHGSSGGSSGGVYQSYQPSVVVPGTVIDGGYYDGGVPVQPQSGSEASGQNPPPPPAAEARIGNDAALLTVAVPESARVLVNGNPTTSQGPIRQFMSRGLKADHRYTYVVEVQATVDGRSVTDRKTVQLRAGDAERLVFAVPEVKAEATETALTLQVPADAEVTLAGNPTKVTGEMRTFRTQQLAAGQMWDDYTIQVAVVRDGQRLTQEKTIRLQGGAQQQLTFDFDEDSVALASR